MNPWDPFTPNPKRAGQFYYHPSLEGTLVLAAFLAAGFVVTAVILALRRRNRHRHRR